MVLSLFVVDFIFCLSSPLLSSPLWWITTESWGSSPGPWLTVPADRDQPIGKRGWTAPLLDPPSLLLQHLTVHTWHDSEKCLPLLSRKQPPYLRSILPGVLKYSIFSVTLSCLKTKKMYTFSSFIISSVWCHTYRYYIPQNRLVSLLSPPLSNKSHSRTRAAWSSLLQFSDSF